MRKKYGKENSKFYKRWRKMLDRCNNPKSPDYHRYGARGIFVCDEWRDFFTFEKWCEQNFVEGTTLNRINNDGGYSPKNCNFATYSEQAKNRRFTPAAYQHMLACVKIRKTKYIEKYGNPETRTHIKCIVCEETKLIEFFRKGHHQCKQCVYKAYNSDPRWKKRYAGKENV